jgi:hypothetical protein
MFTAEPIEKAASHRSLHGNEDVEKLDGMVAARTPTNIN